MLLIEHDMDFVFAVADWMTVMAEGAGAGRGQAGGDPRQHRRAGGLSREAMPDAAPCTERPLLEARGLDTYYGQSQSCAASRSRSRAGETIGLMGRNGMGKTTLIAHADGPGAAARAARCCSTART